MRRRVYCKLLTRNFQIPRQNAEFVTRMRALVPITLVIVTLLSGCGRKSESVAPPQQDWFVDRATEAGIDFVHVNGMSGKLYMSEILGSGVALFDYDNDGWPGIYVPNFGRSTLHRDNRDGTLTDVTGKAGVGGPGWSSSAPEAESARLGCVHRRPFWRDVRSH